MASLKKCDEYLFNHIKVNKFLINNNAIQRRLFKRTVNL